jgi:hypothetical protein
MEDEFIKLVKAIVSVGKKPESMNLLSSIMIELKTLNPRYFAAILENYYDIQFYLGEKRTQIATDLGVALPQERRLVCLLLEKIDLDRLKTEIGNKEAVCRKINELIANNKLTFQINPNKIDGLAGDIKKLKLLHIGLNNLELLDKLNNSIEIMPYSLRYKSMGVAQINSELKMLENSWDEIEKTPNLLPEHRKIATSALKTTGHSDMSLADKAATDLNWILFKQYFAAKGTVWAMQRKKGQIVTKNDILDGIAYCLAKRNEPLLFK